MVAAESIVHVVAVDPASGDEVWRSPPLPGRTAISGIEELVPLDGGAAVAVLLPGEPDSVVVLDAATGALVLAKQVTFEL